MICRGTKTPYVMLFKMLQAWSSKASSKTKLTTLSEILERNELNDSAVWKLRLFY
ncbi:hypothetical protein Ocin01_13611, partial [Orchesella cincta]